MRYVNLLVVILGVSIYWGCNSSTETEPVNPDCEISVDPSSLNLEAGLSDTLSGTVQTLNELNCKNNEINWESSNPVIASIKTINDTTAKITAKSKGSTYVRAFISNAQAEIKISVKFTPIVTYDVGEINISVANKFGNERVITKNKKQEIFPDWIESDRIAYINVAEGVLYSITPEGNNKKIISREFSSLSDFDISKDNSKAAISGRLAENQEVYEIYAKDLNKNTINRLTFEGNEAGRVPAFPYWSPDGEKIAFQTYRDGNWEIYTMNADGSNQKNITNTPNQDEIKPSWSNNGNKIAFISGLGGTIEVMSSNGSNRQKVTNGTYHSWTTDNKIVFSNGDKILTINPDGSNEEIVVNSKKDKTTPSWKPEN